MAPVGFQSGEPLYPGPELRARVPGPSPGSTLPAAGARGGIETSSSPCAHPVTSTAARRATSSSGFATLRRFSQRTRSSGGGFSKKDLMPRPISGLRFPKIASQSLAHGAGEERFGEDDLEDGAHA